MESLKMLFFLVVVRKSDPVKHLLDLVVFSDGVKRVGNAINVNIRHFSRIPGLLILVLLSVQWTDSHVSSASIACSVLLFQFK